MSACAPHVVCVFCVVATHICFLHCVLSTPVVHMNCLKACLFAAWGCSAALLGLLCVLVRSSVLTRLLQV